MKGRIIKVMSDVFIVDEKSINDNSDINNTEKWDSINHLNLLISLEDEFDILINERESVKMISYKMIYEILSGKNIT